MSTVTDTELNEVLALVQSMDSGQVNAVDMAIKLRRTRINVHRWQVICKHCGKSSLFSCLRCAHNEFREIRNKNESFLECAHCKRRETSMTHNCIPFSRPQTFFKNDRDKFIRLTEYRKDLDKTRIRSTKEKTQSSLKAAAAEAKVRAKKDKAEKKAEKKAAEIRRNRRYWAQRKEDGWN